MTPHPLVTYAVHILLTKSIGPRGDFTNDHFVGWSIMTGERGKSQKCTVNGYSLRQKYTVRLPRPIDLFLKSLKFSNQKEILQGKPKINLRPQVSS